MKKQRSNLQRFFIGFSVAMLVLVPLVLCVWIFAVPKSTGKSEPSEPETPVSTPTPHIPREQPEFTLAAFVLGRDGGLLVAFSLELDARNSELRAVVAPGVHIEALRHELRARGMTYETADAARAAAFCEATGVVPDGYAALGCASLARVFEAFGSFPCTLPVPVVALDEGLRAEFSLDAGEYELNPKTAALLLKYSEALDEQSKYAVLCSLISCAAEQYSQKSDPPLGKLKGLEYSGNLENGALAELSAAARAVLGDCTVSCEPVSGRFLENLFVPD